MYYMILNLQESKVTKFAKRHESDPRPGNARILYVPLEAQFFIWLSLPDIQASFELIIFPPPLSQKLILRNSTLCPAPTAVVSATANALGLLCDATSIKATNQG